MNQFLVNFAHVEILLPSFVRINTRLFQWPLCQLKNLRTHMEKEKQKKKTNFWYTNCQEINMEKIFGCKLYTKKIKFSKKLCDINNLLYFQSSKKKSYDVFLCCFDCPDFLLFLFSAWLPLMEWHLFPYYIFSHCSRATEFVDMYGSPFSFWSSARSPTAYSPSLNKGEYWRSAYPICKIVTSKSFSEKKLPWIYLICERLWFNFGAFCVIKNIHPCRRGGNKWLPLWQKKLFLKWCLSGTYIRRDGLHFFG